MAHALVHMQLTRNTKVSAKLKKIGPRSFVVGAYRNECALHLQRLAKMWNETFAEFDGVAGGEVRPFGTIETA